MPIYKCEKCDKEFNRKSNYDTHMMRKFSCTKEVIVNHKKRIINRKKQPDTFECRYCKKIFERKFNMERHIAKCTIKKKSDGKMEELMEKMIQLEENNKKLNQLEEENKKMKKMLEETSKKIEKKTEKLTTEITQLKKDNKLIKVVMFSENKK